MSGSSGGGGTTTTTTNLPKWLEPYAKSFIGSYGREAFGPDYDPESDEPGEVIGRPEGLDQQVAGFDPAQEQALAGIEALVPGAQNVAGMGAGQTGQTLGGQYLQDPTGGNPYLDPLQQTIEGGRSVLGDNAYLNKLERTAGGEFRDQPVGQDPYLAGREATAGGQFRNQPIGQDPYLAQLEKTAGGGFTADPTGDNQFLDQGLTETAQGQFLHPESNPYLRGTFNAAATDLTNAYRTATAPSIQAQASRMGQFGSSAMNEALALEQYGLGRNLENLASNIYGGNYQQERGRMAGAQQFGAGLYEGAYGRERGAQEAQAAGLSGTYQAGYGRERGLEEAQRTGLSGTYQAGYGRERGLEEAQATQLADYYQQGYGRERGAQEAAIGTGVGTYQTGYEGERGRQMDIMGMLPQTIQSLFAPSQALMGAGSMRQGQEQAELDTQYKNAVSQAEWPFNILSGFGGALGQAGSGAGTSTTRSSGGGK